MIEPIDIVGIGVRNPRATHFALFQKGFRPFFLLSAMFALAAVPLWILVLRAKLSPSGWLSPIDWHAHEMVFGFAAAVIAGFLLTAVGNWTKRETAIGWHLAALALIWLAGRAVFFLEFVPAPLGAGINLLFLPALAWTLGRALLSAKNRRNYGFLVLLLALWLAQMSVHAAALGITTRWPRTGALVGVDLVLLAILVVGGRIIPLFTRNATGRDGIQNRPRLDRASLGFMVLLAILDAFAVSGAWLALVAGLTAVVSLARCTRWGAQHTLGEPLLWVLHAGYLFVPLGLLLRAAAALGALPQTAALHMLTTGAIGTLTLGMMVRVALGHTGRPLRAGRWFGVAFAAIALAAVVRVSGGITAGDWYLPSLYLSASFWSLAFSAYLFRLAKVLVTSRPDGQRG